MLKRLGHARLDFLDQLRALAIISVAITHFHSPWLPGGGIGVGIFFALSGFLITTILLEEELNGASVGKFIVRRFMRIYPAYLTALAATVLLTYLDHPEKIGAVLSELPPLLTFTYQPKIWFGYGIGVLWTLQVEMSFYLAVPIVMLVFGKRRGVLILLAILLLASTAQSWFLRSGPSLLHWSLALMLGAILSVAWKSGLLRATRLRTGMLAIVSLTGIAILLPLPPRPAEAWLAEVLTASLCGCGLIAAFLMQPSLPVIWGTAWIGRISYSLYLVHGIVIDHQARLSVALPPRLSNHHQATYIALVIGISAASYYLIEKPGIRAGKMLASVATGQRHSLIAKPSSPKTRAESA